MQVRNGVIAAAIAAFAISVSVQLRAQPPAPQTPPQTPPTQTPATPPPGAVQTPPQGEHGGQAPAPTPAPAAPAGQGQGRRAPGQGRFPAQQRPPADPAVVARGKAVYAGVCSACHGMDARGGQLGGVNLLRSQLVLNDKDGELIQPVVQNGRLGVQVPMPPIPMAVEDIKAIATFLHDLQAKGSNQGGPPPGDPVPLNVLVGDAKAGGEFFAARCATCHSATGDLQGIATRVGDPKVLQNLWVSGGAARMRGPGGAARPVVTATIAQSSGEKVEGRLVRIDDFLVTVALADGTQRSFRRSGDVPKVEIKDPLATHRELLAVYTNKNMHDVTAYLASLK